MSDNQEFELDDDFLHDDDQPFADHMMRHQGGGGGGIREGSHEDPFFTANEGQEEEPLASNVVNPALLDADFADLPKSRAPPTQHQHQQPQQQTQQPPVNNAGAARGQQATEPSTSLPLSFRLRDMTRKNVRLAKQAAAAKAKREAAVAEAAQQEQRQQQQGGQQEAGGQQQQQPAVVNANVNDNSNNNNNNNNGDDDANDDRNHHKEAGGGSACEDDGRPQSFVPAPPQHNWSTNRRVKWSTADTEKFYLCLRQFGTNFSAIARFFPNLERMDVVRKYKAEKAVHPDTVAHAMSREQHIVPDEEAFEAAAHEWMRLRALQPKKTLTAEEEQFLDTAAVEGAAKQDEANLQQDADNNNNNGGAGEPHHQTHQQQQQQQQQQQPKGARHGAAARSGNKGGAAGGGGTVPPPRQAPAVRPRQQQHDEFDLDEVPFDQRFVDQVELGRKLAHDGDPDEVPFALRIQDEAENLPFAFQFPELMAGGGGNNNAGCDRSSRSAAPAKSSGSGGSASGKGKERTPASNKPANGQSANEGGEDGGATTTATAPAAAVAPKPKPASKKQPGKKQQRQQELAAAADFHNDRPPLSDDAVLSTMMMSVSGSTEFDLAAEAPRAGQEDPLAENDDPFELEGF